MTSTPIVEDGPPTCPDCDSPVWLAALMSWTTEGWVHESDDGDYYCPECETSVIPID